MTRLLSTNHFVNTIQPLIVIIPFDKYLWRSSLKLSCSVAISLKEIFILLFSTTLSNKVLPNNEKNKTKNHIENVRVIFHILAPEIHMEVNRQPSIPTQLARVFFFATPLSTLTQKFGNKTFEDILGRWALPLRCVWLKAKFVSDDLTSRTRSW